MKVAREELAPIVAENAKLTEERDRLVEQNASLEQEIKWENERRKRLITLSEVDYATLDSKIDRLTSLYGEMQKAIGPNNPEAFKVLEEMSELIKPKSNYTSISEAYIQAGQPVKEDKARFEQFQKAAQITAKEDGIYNANGKRIASEIALSKQGLTSMPIINPGASTQTPTAPSTPTSQGPKPNPMSSGTVQPIKRPPGTDPGRTK